MISPNVLIADAGKASLVMTSEVVKTKLPGAVVHVAATGKECLAILEGGLKADMVICDFDLPDTDGVTLINLLRKIYSGPILLTAYPDKVVEGAVLNDLFAYRDAGAWVKKPVEFEELGNKVENFLINKERLEKRFSVEVQSTIVGKGAGRGKRAPKSEGQVKNLSVSGMCVEVASPIKLSKGDELSLSLLLPIMPTTKKQKEETNEKVEAIQKVKVKVAWVSSSEVGLEFGKLTEVQKRGVERLMRESGPSHIKTI